MLRQVLYIQFSMSFSSATMTQPRIRGGLKLKGGVVIRAAAPPHSTAQSGAATTKRKEHPTSHQDDPLTTAATPPIKSETHTTHSLSDTSLSSPPHSPHTATTALPSEAPVYVKRTKRADEVEEVNAQLQHLNKIIEQKDRRQLIEEDRQRAAQQLTAVEEREADGLRLVDVSRGYVKHGFGDESAMTATRRLNEREKRKSDRYCK